MLDPIRTNLMEVVLGHDWSPGPDSGPRTPMTPSVRPAGRARTGCCHPRPRRRRGSCRQKGSSEAGPSTKMVAPSCSISWSSCSGMIRGTDRQGLPVFLGQRCAGRQDLRHFLCELLDDLGHVLGESKHGSPSEWRVCPLDHCSDPPLGQTASRESSIRRLLTHGGEHPLAVRHELVQRLGPLVARRDDQLSARSSTYAHQAWTIGRARADGRPSAVITRSVETERTDSWTSVTARVGDAAAVDAG